MELEYKVIQSTTPMFANAQKMTQVLAEEAQAGWALVEKFDNYRLRLQRDISHREQDKDRALDPYRTQVGVSNIVAYGTTTLVTLIVVYAIFNIVGAM